MGLSDKIEAFILELMKQEQEDWLKIQRNELAGIFGCVPSQINYVIRTRFNPEQGYIVESRRGGGGCVRIRKVNTLPSKSDALSESDCRIIIDRLFADSAISARESRLMKAAISDSALDGTANKDITRANILKEMLNCTSLKEELI